MIKSLQSLRGIGAIMIFIHHFGFEGDVVTSFGDFGVCLFMMLSGFVLAFSFQGRGERKVMHYSVRAFMISRVIKIYPLYLVAWVMSVLLIKFGSSPLCIVSSLLMLQSWIPDRQVYFGINGPAWFISDLMFCYLLFLPFFRYLMYGRGNRWILSLLYVAYVVVAVSVPERYVMDIVYIQPLMQMPVFMLGVILLSCLKKGIGKKIKWYVADLSVASSVLLCVVAVMFYGFVDIRYGCSLYWWFPVVVLIAVFTLADSSCSILVKFFHFRPMLAFGDASFSFYILHMPWIYFYRLVLSKLNVDMSLYEEFFTSLVFLTVIFITVKKTIEMPLSKWLSSLVESVREGGRQR